jgi:hypothetical protein
MDDELARQGRARGGGQCDLVASGAAVHGDDGLEPVTPVGGGREPDPAACRDLLDARLEGDGRDVVAFVDDHQPIAGGARYEIAAVGEALGHGQVDNRGLAVAAAAELPDLVGREAEMLLEARTPLLQQGLAVHDHQGRLAVPREERTGQGVFQVDSRSRSFS